MPKTADMLNNLLKLALLIFAVYILYQLVQKLFGGSWSIEELILALMILNLGWTVSLQKQLSVHIGEHKGYSNAKSGLELKG